MDILVSGASVAGPAVAYWLSRAGHRVVVVERADGLRTAGHNVDVRGSGREVLRRMGIEEAALQQTTGEQGTRFVDERSVLAQFPAGDDDSSGATAALEILRGRLSALLVEAAADVEYVFGDQISDLEHDDAVTVSFASGRTQPFDLVIVAEGARSRTRGRFFSDVGLRELGMYTAFGTIPRRSDDDAWWTWYNAVGGRSISLRPDNIGSTRVALSFLSDNTGIQDLEPDEQRAAVSAVFADAGWQAGRVCAALPSAAELYVDYLTQVRAGSWAIPRMVLCGDAAWCATPVSGIGTTLALTGAYILAGELSSTTSVSEACAAYENRMRPLVERAQKLPPGTPQLAHPRSRVGLLALRTALRVAGSTPARALACRINSPKTEARELPHYPALHD